MEVESIYSPSQVGTGKLNTFEKYVVRSPGHKIIIKWMTGCSDLLNQREDVMRCNKYLSPQCLSITDDITGNKT